MPSGDGNTLHAADIVFPDYLGTSKVHQKLRYNMLQVSAS